MLISYLLAAFFVAATAASLRFLPALHPVQLWCLPWTAATLLFCLRLLPMEPISAGAAGLIVAATACFTAGTLLAGPAYERLPQRARRAWKPIPDQLTIAASLSLVLLTVAMALQLGPQIADHGLGATLVSSGQLKAETLQTDNPRFIYFAIVAVTLTAMASATAEDRLTGRLWGIGCGAAISTPYFTSGRGVVMYLLGVACLAYLLTRRTQPTMRQLLAGAAAFGAVIIAVTMAIGVLQDRGLTKTSDLGSVPSVFRDHDLVSQLAVPYSYAALPLSGLTEQVKLSSALGESDGCASARIVCNGLNRLGLDVEPVDPARPFTSRPLRFNLYTALDLPLADGGYIFAPLILGLTGFVLGLLWCACRRGSLVGLVGYPIIGAACFYATSKYDFASQYLIGALIISLLLVATAHLLASGLDRKVGLRADT